MIEIGELNAITILGLVVIAAGVVGAFAFAISELRRHRRIIRAVEDGFIARRRRARP